MNKKQVVLAVLGVVIVGLGGLAYAGYAIMTGPMYSPGKMGKTDSQPKAAIVREGYFLMPDGAKLGYMDTGTGKPVLVLHGGPGYPFTSAWNGMDRIDGYRFIYYDQRGCGTSDRPFDRFTGGNFYENLKTLEGTLGIAAQLRDIESIRKGLGVEKIALIGHSFGGFLAALYAIEFPSNVDRLILVAPAAVMVMPNTDGNLYSQVEKRLTEPADIAKFKSYMKRYFDFQAVFDKTERELSDLNAEFTEYFVKAAQKDGTGAANASAASSESYRPGSIGGFMTWALYFSMGSRHDYRPALKNIAAPVLLFAGTADMAGIESVVRNHYANHIPGSRLVTIQGTGHFPFEEKPDEFRNAVSSFMKEGT